jgi:group I intron endonuclease
MVDKKEIKRNYKATPTPMGIFQIRNLVNGKIFIGSSMNLPGRKNRFDLELSLGTMMDHVLQKDFLELGRENFIFEVLDNLEPKEDPAYDYKDDLKTLEELWIEKLQPFDDRGYNKKKTR